MVVRGSLNFLANPKSMTLIIEDDLPTPITKFAGLTSLWTKSREWMNSIRSSWEREGQRGRKRKGNAGDVEGVVVEESAYQLVCDEKDSLEREMFVAHLEEVF